MQKCSVLLLLTIITLNAFSQASSFGYNTTLPILYINPNPQAGAFGEIGTVSSSIYKNVGLTHNPALLSGNKKIAGIEINLSTWSNYNPHTYLGNPGIYFSVDKNNKFGYSFDYFGVGKVRFENNDSILSKPYQCYHSLRYAHAFSDELSAGIGIKIIKSDLAPKVKPSFTTFSVDLGVDYRKQFQLSKKSGIRLDLGFSAQDIGPKISYTQDITHDADNIPTDIAAGIMLTYCSRIKEKSTFNFDLAYQIETIVVPTPSIYSAPSNGWLDEIKKSNSPGLIPVYGYFGSFERTTDTNVLKASAFVNKFGAEIRINIKEIFLFSVRGGHIQEFESKGGAGYYSIGAGIGFYGFRFDYSRLLIQPNSIGTFGLSYEINLASKKAEFTEN